ncbi:MBL fold metallo-hydrolase [Pseudonocardia sp. ICBG601]|uniref:MBL fold metallo-hydrolase n=1 Tax=Pseudonocardia sp. ICBG601 TaxID=2846759 RepID=UPI001CF69014|nr:hypothetical protein [Pseudonocardia sp. ICBG601]
MSRSKRLPTAAVLSVPLALTGALAALGLHVRRNMGARPGELRRIASASPNAVDGLFANTEPGLPRAKASARMILNMLVGRRSAGGAPATVPLAPLRTPAEPAGLAVTWLGHAGVLLEIDGRRALVDPVWSEYASPVPRFGPRRLHPPVRAAVRARLPGPRGAQPTTTTTTSTVRRSRALARDTSAVFVGPLGVGAHLRSWGIPGHRVVERDTGRAW